MPNAPEQHMAKQHSGKPEGGAARRGAEKSKTYSAPEAVVAKDGTVSQSGSKVLTPGRSMVMSENVLPSKST